MIYFLLFALTSVLWSISCSRPKTNSSQLLCTNFDDVPGQGRDGMEASQRTIFHRSSQMRGCFLQMNHVYGRRIKAQGRRNFESVLPGLLNIHFSLCEQELNYPEEMKLEGGMKQGVQIHGNLIIMSLPAPTEMTTSMFQNVKV